MGPNLTPTGKSKRKVVKRRKTPVASSSSSAPAPAINLFEKSTTVSHDSELSEDGERAKDFGKKLNTKLSKSKSGQERKEAIEDFQKNVALALFCRAKKDK